MKKSAFFMIIILICAAASAETRIGKIVQIINDVDLTSSSTGKKITPKIGDTITTDHRIRTGKKSLMDILLNNGTILSIKEVSVLSVSNLKIEDSDPPTRLKMLTGKLRIMLKKIYKTESLILKTPTAIAAVRGTDFGVITTNLETKIVVFDGRVEVGAENKDIKKSYILKKREETSIKKNEPPVMPKILPAEIIENWFDHYEIDNSNKIVTKAKKDEGILDWIMRKRDY